MYLLRKWKPGPTNQGGKDHLAARDRIIGLLNKMGIVCLTERKFHTKTERGELPYEPDIVAAFVIVPLNLAIGAVVEIDGKTHDGKIPRGKDHHRDKAFLENEGMATVRYGTYDVVGRKKIDDETLQREFWWKVNEVN